MAVTKSTSTKGREKSRKTRIDSQPASTPRLPKSPKPPEDLPVEQLLTLVIAALKESEHHALRVDEDGNEVLLEREVDGFELTITRKVDLVSKFPVELTPREREVVRMVAQGYPNKTIAHVLEISRWTVSTYLRRVFAKLNVHSRAAMIRRLVEEKVDIDWGASSDRSDTG